MQNVRSLVIVYDADGGLVGELRYLLGKVAGTAQCAACDITHGLTGEKAEWRACKVELGVPVKQLHRNELDASQAAACDDLPCVLAETADGHVMVLGREPLEACGGDVAAFRRALDEKLHAVALRCAPEAR